MVKRLDLHSVPDFLSDLQWEPRKGRNSPKEIHSVPQWVEQLLDS